MCVECLFYSHWVNKSLFVARPRISEVVEDTKILLQQSRERLVITYVLRIASSPNGGVNKIIFVAE